MNPGSSGRKSGLAASHLKTPHFQATDRRLAVDPKVQATRYKELPRAGYPARSHSSARTAQRPRGQPQTNRRQKLTARMEAFTRAGGRWGDGGPPRSVDPGPGGAGAARHGCRRLRRPGIDLALAGPKSMSTADCGTETYWARYLAGHRSHSLLLVCRGCTIFAQLGCGRRAGTAWRLLLYATPAGSQGRPRAAMQDRRQREHPATLAVAVSGRYRPTARRTAVPTDPRHK